MTESLSEDTKRLTSPTQVVAPIRVNYRKFVRAIGAVAIAVAFMRLIAVDIAGIVTNDSVGYLRRASDPFSDGLVNQGYRQVGYPLCIAFSNLVGDVLGWDHIFGVAFLQRLMLIVGIAALIWAARWWSAPTVLIVTSASYVLLADFVLAEGIVVPLCLLSGALVTAASYRRVSRRFATTLLVTSALVAILAGSIKLQFASLLAVTAATGWVLVRDSLCTRRVMATTLAVSAVLIAGLATAQAAENHKKLGTFEPIAERHRSMWWGAWQTVFAMNPERGKDPALAIYYDEGDLYTFLHGIERDVPDYETRRQQTIARTQSMLEAAGTSVWEERAKSFVGSFRGGRWDDLSGMTQRTLGNLPGEAERRLESNYLARDHGIEALLRELNDGELPGIVSAGPVLDPAQAVVDDYRRWLIWLGPLALLILLLGATAGRRERPAAISALAAYLACAAAMASGFTDNARYLVGPLTVVLIVATNVVRELFIDESARLRRTHTRPSGSQPILGTDAEARS